MRAIDQLTTDPIIVADLAKLWQPEESHGMVAHEYVRELRDE